MKPKLNAIDICSLIAIVALFFLLFYCCTGCTVTKWSNGTESFSRTSFATKLNAQTITVTIGTNGARTMTITGYASDGATTAALITEAAVKGAVQGMK